MNVKTRPKLKATLSLLDAVGIGIGAIIGAGIFVVIGIAAVPAGNGLVVSIIIAGLVSLFTAMSTSELGSRIIKEGGIYEFAAEMISPFVGFLTGWVWLVSNIFVGAAVALGFGHYLNGLIPSIDARLSAAILCIVLTAVNLTGARHSSFLNNILVIIKLLVLTLFVVVGSMHIKTDNILPVSPFRPGIIYGAYFIFFAYSGFARIAIVSEEIKDPEKNVPQAIYLSLGISAIVYILVGFVAIGVAGASVIGESDSPLSDAMKIAGSLLASQVVSSGALVATATVLLTTILGISRVTYSIASKGDLPHFLSVLSPNSDTPLHAVWISGVIMAVLAVFTNLTQVVSISVFSSLFYYVAANISALRMRRQDRRFPDIIPIIGTLTCIGLVVVSAIEAPISLIAGVLCLLVGAFYYGLDNRLVKRRRPHRL
jgi:APA family basic amino acid/polyamine antiporter